MKIIVLDDSMTIRMIIKSFLEDLGVKDDEVFLFENGYEALDFIKLNGADIVLSDINMPYMDGCEFASLVFKVIPDLKSSFFVKLSFKLSKPIFKYSFSNLSHKI